MILAGEPIAAGAVRKPGARSRCGGAGLNVESVAGLSAATSIHATDPLKLLVPIPRGPSVWAFTSSYGGGLVAGDQTRLDVQLAGGTRCFLGTQASTKIYRNPELRPCRHTTRAEVGAGALLVFAPDPVQAFAESIYKQRQEFHLAADGNLVLVDWLSGGRTARGERWAFHRFESRNAVFINAEQGMRNAESKPGCPNGESELAFLDSLRLSTEDGALVMAHRTGRFNCFATLLMIGPAVSSFAVNLLAEVKQMPVPRQASLLCSASPVRDGVVLRLAAESVEAVGHELHRHLSPLSSLLGDDPWARKW